ncbi:hypothetical protein [Luteolibacter marinus]|uniref:hypothetical protein n=1 Tax=Luteolibacter marinus TaxID=2776705 RepID=UPI0018664AF2|nr:hypothetical protein [Luteolibacter marinus]
MAKPVKSIWTVTFDKGGANELVLVEPDLLLEDELAGLGAQQVTEDGDYVDADDSEPLGYGKTKRNLSITVYREHVSAAAAREYVLSSDLAVPVNLRATLTIEITGGATYTLANSVFQSWRTVPRRIGVHQTATTYELKCGALALGAPAGPTPVGLDDAAANFARETGLLDAGSAAPDHLEAAASWLNSGTGDDASQATAGERPTTLTGSGLYTPGSAGNSYSLAHHATLSPGANFSLRWDGSLPSYYPGARVCLLSKWNTTGDLRSYALYVNAAGTITLAVSTDGTAGTVTEWTSALPTGLAANQAAGIQVTKEGTSLRFYIYPTTGYDDAVEFSPAQTVSNLTPANVASGFYIGSTDAGTADLLSGITARAQLWTTTSWFQDSTVLRLLFDVPSGSGSVFPSGITIARSGTAPCYILDGPTPRFDGTDDSFTMDTPVALNAVSGATVIWYGMINRVSGTNDLVFCGTNSTDPRICLRVDGGDLKLLVRRLDGEATATITAAGAVAAFFQGTLSASIDYTAGTAILYKDGAAVAAGSLTSAGTTSATDSSETRFMAGQGGANPAAAQLQHVLIREVSTGPFDHADLVASVVAASRIF